VRIVCVADRNPRRRVEGNRVIYTRVLSAHDNAVLQCVASNDHGSILANAALKVIGLSSFVIVEPLDGTESVTLGLIQDLSGC